MSPLSASLEWWSAPVDGLGIAAIIIGAILAIVTGLGWGFSWKAGKLKDAALDKYKRESDERISIANARALREAQLALEQFKALER